MTEVLKAKQPWGANILNVQDLDEIGYLAATLPGNWRYVADVAIRPSDEPCVWIYPADERYKLSVGFSKTDGLIAVTVRHDSGRIVKTPLLCASVTDAFTSLYEGLGHLQLKYDRRERLRRSICVSCVFMFIMIPIFVAIIVSI